MVIKLNIDIAYILNQRIHCSLVRMSEQLFLCETIRNTEQTELVVSITPMDIHMHCLSSPHIKYEKNDLLLLEKNCLAVYRAVLAMNQYHRKVTLCWKLSEGNKSVVHEIHTDRVTLKSKVTPR